MSTSIGKRKWAIAEGYIPGWSTGPKPEMKSHETICILNANMEDAHVSLMAFFNDQDPAGPYEFIAPGRRTLHIRLNKLADPAPLPIGKEFAIVIESDIPVVVQHTRLDSRQSENALMTTIAYAHSE